MRKDFYVQNDSGAFGVISAGFIEAAVADGRANDAQWAERGEAILVGLVGDDSFVARVVVGEPLTPAERDEWIAVIRRPLRVAGGKLVVGAGFDPDVLAQWLAEGDGPNARSAEVPDGEYLASVYTYLHTMNGRVLAEPELHEKLGAWFRRDHPGRAFPSWVASELHRAPDRDPGHESEWRALAASVKAGKLRVETHPLDWVGFLIHLEPKGTPHDLSEPGPDGFFAETTGLRKPARFPLGVPSLVQDPELRGELREIL